MVSTALKVKKSEETNEPLSIIVEILRASGYNTEERITTFVKVIVHKKLIPCDCQEMIKKQQSFGN